MKKALKYYNQDRIPIYDVLGCEQSTQMDCVAKLFVYGFKWGNYNYNFNKHFTKIMMKIRTKDMYLK